MKKTILIFFILSPFLIFGQEPTFEWVVQMGGIEDDKGNGITTDHLGNVFVTGDFGGTVDFDPGPGEHLLTATVATADFYNDIFVAKYASDGQLQWAYSFGDTLEDRGVSIATDTSGNVYIVGEFSHSAVIDFDPGPNTFYLPTNTTGRSFILKLSGNGDFIWARRFSGSFFPSAGNHLAVDISGNAYITGDFGDIGDFDPGPAVYNLEGVDNTDIFILKLDSNGDFVWARGMGGSEGDYGLSIALDSLNNVYTTGFFRDDADFDPGPEEYILEVCGGQYDRDVFISKLNSEGDFIWAKSIGDCGDSATGYGIAVSKGGEVYTTGSFGGTLDFDPGPEEYELSTLWWNAIDIFILKLSPEGTFEWAKNIGLWDPNRGNAIALDDENNIYTTGAFEGLIDFDPGADTFYLLSDERDIFVVKLDSTGSFIWAGALVGDGGGTWPSGRAIALDSWNNIYTTGGVLNTTDFDPGTGSYELTSNGVTDVYIHKLRQECLGTPITSIIADLELCGADSETVLEVYGGSSYSWNTTDTTNIIQVVTNADAVYSVTVTDGFGCTGVDSVVVLVHPLVDTSYMEASTCDTMEVGIITYNYFDVNDCDSIVIETTELIPLPNAPTPSADIMITENEFPFEVSITEVPNATSYIWSVPEGIDILSGDGTNSVFIDWNGSTISDSICVSAVNECGNSVPSCMEITVDITDVVKTIDKKEINVFPNPVMETLYIRIEDELEYKMALLNALGQKVISEKMFSGKAQLDMRHLASGSYWLKINDVDLESVPVFVKVEIIK